jgi:hypothetical protein
MLNDSRLGKLYRKCRMLHAIPWVLVAGAYFLWVYALISKLRQVSWTRVPGSYGIQLEPHCCSCHKHLMLEVVASWIHVMLLPCPPTCTIVFSLSTITPFSTCLTTILFFHTRIDPFQLLYNLWKYCILILTFHFYTSPHISYSTFHIPSCHWLCEA